MRQLFTVPHMKGETRNWKLARLPELVAILPAIIFSLGVIYDFYSTFGLLLYYPHSVIRTLGIDSILFVLIWALCLKCLGRKRHINSIWDDYWGLMNGMKTSVILLNRELVEEFGRDEFVNDALRELRVRRSEANTPPPSHST
jgi:hypothetical protein